MSATQNQANKKMWDMFLEKSFFYEDNFYINLILENIEALQYQQSTDKDLMEYFDDNFIFKYIIPEFGSDVQLLKLLNILENGHRKVMVNDDNGIDILNILGINLEYNPPKLSLVNKIAKKTLEKLHLMTEELSEVFEDNRRKYIKTGSTGTEVFKEHYDIENWVD